jgi:hypothetical protein
MKKICVLFGNCQCNGIREFLKFSDFYSLYDVHQFANWQLIEDEKSLPINLLKKADLIIYQPLSDVYGCYSTNINNTNSFFKLLKSDCIKISFPRIHNNAIFPIFKKHKDKKIYYGSIEKKPLEQIISDYENNIIDFNFEQRWNDNIKISREKEQNCDVKIIDFIIENMSKHKLFLTHDHPTSIIFNELTKQICKILNLSYNCTIDLIKNENITQLKDSVYNRSDNQYPISRYSIKFFKFEYIQNECTDANDFYLSNIKSYCNTII